MATTYVGQVVTARAPAPIPAAGAVIELSLAADGDPLNAASIAQALKALADYATWAAAPLAPIADYTKVAWFAQNPRGLARGGFDHGGFPSGRLWSLRENWLNAPLLNTAGSAYYGQGWYSVLVNTIPTQSSIEGEPAANGFVLTIEAGQSIGDKADIGTPVWHLVCGADTDAMIEFDAYMASTSSTSLGGFMNTILTTPLNAITAGAYFRSIAGGNIQCVTGDGTTTAVITTSLAPTGPQRMRIQLQGANASDDGTARALFWINGTLVANQTANLPTVAASQLGTRFGAFQPGGGVTGGLSIGNVNVQQASWAGNNFL